jgi:integrase
MSVYLIKGKGWRYDFIQNGNRYSEAGFKTKREARQAEAKKREEIENPVQPSENVTTPTDMAFLELVNRRLDYVKAYSSERYYTDHQYMCRRWVKQWKRLNCSDISGDKIQSFLLKRARTVSASTANKELRSLRALFNFGIHPARGWIKKNPTYGIAFFPVEKKLKYIPLKEDVLRVILAADRDIQDYLWTIALTMGRMSEINRLTWQDVDFQARYIDLVYP